jgi:hypothetical protein
VHNHRTIGRDAHTFWIPPLTALTAYLLTLTADLIADLQRCCNLLFRRVLLRTYRRIVPRLGATVNTEGKAAFIKTLGLLVRRTGGLHVLLRPPLRSPRRQRRRCL